MVHVNSLRYLQGYHNFCDTTVLVDDWLADAIWIRSLDLVELWQHGGQCSIFGIPEFGKSKEDKMSIDLKSPGIHTEIKDGKTIATICAAEAQWARISDPEPLLDANGAPSIDKHGNPRNMWSVELRLPKTAKGVREFMDACVDLRKKELKGVGKLAVCKDGDKEHARLVEELGKDPEKISGILGKVLIKANTTIKPTIHNEVYSGCIASAVIQLATYDRDGSKGVKGYLQEIGRVGAGERLSAGSRAPMLSASAFDSDAPVEPVKTAPAGYDNDPDDLPFG